MKWTAVLRNLCPKNAVPLPTKGPKNLKIPKMVIMGSWKKRVVKVEKMETLEKQLGWMHENVVGSFHDLLDVVPSNDYLGTICGSRINSLQSEREWLEQDLSTLNEAQEKHVVHMRGMQRETGEMPGQGEILHQGEILQTTTIPPNDVRKELPQW